METILIYIMGYIGYCTLLLKGPDYFQKGSQKKWIRAAGGPQTLNPSRGSYNKGSKGIRDPFDLLVVGCVLVVLWPLYYNLKPKAA